MTIVESMFYNFLIVFVIINEISCEPDRRVITTLKYCKNYVKPTVVNGEKATAGQVPYIVSIKEPSKRIGAKRIVWRNLCGGSIIDKFRVLSAAHCFESNKFRYVQRPDILRAVAGNLRSGLTHSGDTETNIITQWRKFDKIIVHKKYYFPNNDIALAIVNEEWQFTGNIDYIDIARRSIDYPPSCISAGYGRIGYSLRDAVSPTLLIARIHTLSKWDCSRLWEMNMNKFICTDSSIADVSRGDSGGPLACKNTKDPNEKPGRDLLVGVVSGKNFDKTTIYTRVSEYHDWITGDNSFVLSCNIMLVITSFIVINI